MFSNISWNLRMQENKKANNQSDFIYMYLEIPRKKPVM